MKALLIISCVLFLCPSCTKTLETNKKDAIYVIVQDSSYLIYRPGLELPIVLERPLNFEFYPEIESTLQEQNASDTSSVILRIIDGDVNNIYGVSNALIFYIIITSILSGVFIIKLFIRQKNKQI